MCYMQNYTYFESISVYQQTKPTQSNQIHLVLNYIVAKRHVIRSNGDRGRPDIHNRQTYNMRRYLWES